MERRATLCFPEGFGVELDTIHARFEVLVGDKFMDLANCICASEEKWYWSYWDYKLISDARLISYHKSDSSHNPIMPPSRLSFFSISRPWWEFSFLVHRESLLTGLTIHGICLEFLSLFFFFKQCFFQQISTEGYFQASVSKQFRNTVFSAFIFCK